MSIAACTLFEGGYHLGAAVLVNSLCAAGFAGTIYAGYRGGPPPWAGDATEDSTIDWPGARVLQVTAEVRLALLPLDTDCHLTNYKPDFMLALLAGPCAGDDGLYYFDPDIVINERWTYFQDWVSCGVALCEDVNSPLPENHPRRVGWRRHFGQDSRALAFRTDRYVNGGCVGAPRACACFLEAWREAQQGVNSVVGGGASAKISGGVELANRGFANCLDATDQDALNVAIESSDCPLSILGRDAMAFQAGHAILPHAIGPDKPWATSYAKRAIAGRPPRLVDKLYWRMADSPIQAFSTTQCQLTRASLRVAALAGRFYARR